LFSTFAAGEDDLGGVGDEARLRHDDLVSRIEDGGERQVQRLRHADRDQQLGVGVVCYAVLLMQVLAEGAAQLERAGVAGVVGVARAERGDSGFQDVGRRGEVRLANAERDHVFHRRGDVEEAADAAGRNRSDSLRNVVAHGVCP